MQCNTDEFIKICAKVGFKEVELRYSKVEEYLVDHSWRELRGMLRKYDMHIATVNSLEFFSLVPEENYDFMLKKAEEMIILCQLIGCDFLVVVPSKNAYNLPLKDIKDKTIKRLQRVADLGSIYGVRMSFEPIGFRNFSIRKVLDGLDIVKSIINQKIGLTIDTFNFYVGENSLDDLKKIPGNMISVVHFHDADNIPLDNISDEDRLFPGKGVIDLKKFCKILREKEYDGPLSVELINPNLWKIPPKEIAKKAWDSLEEYV
jgi:2-keto-myo-inositol isomerase